MTDELRLALDNAYHAFRGYKLPKHYAWRDAVAARQLTAEQWRALDAEYDMIVCFYSEGAQELRYFLPRWLEWLSDDQDLPNAPSVWEMWEWQQLAGTLKRARWQDWPAPEVAALRAVLLAWTRQNVAGHGSKPPHYNRESALEFLTEIGEDLAPHLEAWLDANAPALARWLWTVHWDANSSVREWAVSSRLESALEAAFFADPDGANAALFSRSIELVRSLKAR